jgi:hypothetical protein
MVLNGNVIHNKILQRFYTSHYVEMLVYGIIMQKKYLYCRCRYIKMQHILSEENKCLTTCLLLIYRIFY